MARIERPLPPTVMVTKSGRVVMVFEKMPKLMVWEQEQGHGTIVIDGKDIGGIRSMRLNMGVEEATTLELDLFVRAAAAKSIITE